MLCKYYESRNHGKRFKSIGRLEPVIAPDQCCRTAPRLDSSRRAYNRLYFGTSFSSAYIIKVTSLDIEPIVPEYGSVSEYGLCCISKSRALWFLALICPALGFVPRLPMNAPVGCIAAANAGATAHHTVLNAGLSWHSSERYKNQAAPVVALVTRHRAYAGDFEQYFGSRGYHVKVLSTRTLSKLNKFVDRTQPEAIVIDSHVAREELVGFLEAIKGNPDLWLVPVFLLTNTTTPPLGQDTPGLGSGLGTSTTSTPAERSEMGLRSSLLPPRFQPPPPPPRPAPEVVESDGEEEVWRLQCLRAGVDRFLPRCASTFGQLHSVLLGRGAVRRRLERMVSSMQEAILDLRVRRRPLLPSTMILMDDLPEINATQQEVLNLVARGLTDAQIAYSMQITQAGVRNALTKLMTSFKADTRCELVRIALDNDLITE